MAEGTYAAPGGPGMRLDPAHQRAALIILSVIALMVQYVETMVLPAIPTFIRFFQLTSNGVPIATWVLTAYLLVGTVATPIFSKLGDIVGKKRMLVLTMAIYAIAVSVAGFTPDIANALGWSRPNAIYLFIAVRGVQGIGIAMFPLAFAIIAEQFPPNRIGTAQGIVSAMFAAGASAGLVGGAWITDTLGWQATYHSIIPFAFLVLVLAIVLLPPTRVRHAVPLDVAGAATLGVALGGFLVALSEGPTWGWTNWSSVAVGGVSLGVPEFLLIGLAGVIAFFVWEPFARVPIVDFRRLLEGNVLISNIVGTTTSAGMFIIFVSVVYIIQAPTTAYGLGQTIFVSGLLFVPSTLSMLFLGPVIGRSLARVGPRPLMILGGTLVAAGGLLLYAFNRTETQFLFAPIPALVGMVMTFISIINVVVLASRPQEVTIQTGMNQTFRNIGMALGPAIAATILTSYSFAWPVPGTFGRVTVSFPTLTGYEYAFLTTAALGAVGAILSLFLRNYRYLADGTRVEGPATPAGGGPAARGPPASTGAR